MKFRVVTIYWDAEKDIVDYVWGNQFKDVYKVAKLDILQDAIADLTELYNKEVHHE